MVDLTDPTFTDERKAREYFEHLRWPNGVTCPHCGNANSARIYSIKPNKEAKVREGLWSCQDCKGQFTVRTGHVMESSHVPLTKWALAYRLLASAKKGMSAHQLHRTIGVTYKTAWFMAHRVREAMRIDSPTPLGGAGHVIESDETFWGPKDKDTDPARRRIRKGKPGRGRKQTILTLVQRGGGSRSFKMDGLKTADIHGVLD